MGYFLRNIIITSTTVVLLQVAGPTITRRARNTRGTDTDRKRLQITMSVLFMVRVCLYNIYIYYYNVPRHNNIIYIIFAFSAFTAELVYC